jgi:hypothetical protein
MKMRPTGNGSGNFEVGVHDMGGWVRVTAGATAPEGGNLPFCLAHRLSYWFRENVTYGHCAWCRSPGTATQVELHAWYEQHLFPDISPQHQPGRRHGMAADGAQPARKRHQTPEMTRRSI